MGTTTSYVPYDYRRVCDLCGNLFNISRMHKQGPYTYCDAHAGERTNEELDRANARQRPFRILPVPNAKPEDLRAPDVFEAEESVIFDLVGACRAGSSRYLQVLSGSPAPIPYTSDVIPVNAWGIVFYYGLLLRTYPAGHVDVWTAKATAALRAAADTLRALQTLTGSRATNSFYGGFLASGGTNYYAEDTAVAGLAMLYAYRALGGIEYLAAARAAANFLRNLQAIGSNGTNFTSSDAAGTSRLYTGGITNYVVNFAGFFSDHRLYPSMLLALRFWSELKTTDGDQAIGATAAIASEFDTAPSRLLSLCMGDLRSFWEDGTFDAIRLDVRTGLSATTPAECFNAFPAAKAHTPVVGTGAWEYQDGASATGTTITAMNFAKALSALYAVDGLTEQLEAVDDWLQTFTSNSTYETGTGVPTRTLQHVTTGTYDPSVTLAKYLLVRDASASYAAIKKNASSLYDWGAFGLMSPLWATRRALAFKNARYNACLDRRRFSDGLPSDGYWDDRGIQRGRQGLTWQTSFEESPLEHGSGVQF